ncbi:hypothetical protein [Desulforegula conservatrix]|uniref:hypothetical protein n=1 Tax=Desulforegula conservatrix TaxID=153026 RepID=UPI000480996D|nr:hypothetical protein [Desulforegula conservatrix]
MPIKKYGIKRQKKLGDHCQVISMRLFVLIITGSIKKIRKIIVAVFTKQPALYGIKIKIK